MVSGGPSISIADNSKSLDATDITWLRARLRRIVRLLGLDNARVTAVVVDDAEMCRLHREYSGVDGTTDVLTFNLADEPAASSIEGEVYVCVDEARRRAAELSHEPRRELLLYAVHGLLHLLGYDDHDPLDYRRMHEKEDELLRAVGVGPVFAARARGGGGAR